MDGLVTEAFTFDHAFLRLLIRSCGGMDGMFRFGLMLFQAGRAMSVVPKGSVPKEVARTFADERRESVREGLGLSVLAKIVPPVYLWGGGAC